MRLSGKRGRMVNGSTRAFLFRASAFGLDDGLDPGVDHVRGPGHDRVAGRGYGCGFPSSSHCSTFARVLRYAKEAKAFATNKRRKELSGFVKLAATSKAQCQVCQESIYRLIDKQPRLLFGVLAYLGRPLETVEKHLPFYQTKWHATFTPH